MEEKISYIKQCASNMLDSDDPSIVAYAQMIINECDEILLNIQAESDGEDNL